MLGATRKLTYTMTIVDARELSARRKSFAAAHGVQSIDPLEAENERFDFISVNPVLENASEPRETVRQLARILKPSGVIKISAPLANWLRDK